jgi:hypothetical protein
MVIRLFWEQDKLSSILRHPTGHVAAGTLNNSQLCNPSIRDTHDIDFVDIESWLIGSVSGPAKVTLK